MTYTSLLLSTGPVTYQTLSDPAGSPTAADTSPNGHVGTYQGSVSLGVVPSLIPGDNDTALSVSGAGQVAMPNLALTAPFSLSCVVQPTGDGGNNTGYATLFGYSGSRRLLWADTKNGLRILAQMGAASLFTPTGSVPAGKTAHVVYTADGTTESIYVNGALAASQPNAVASWNAAFYLGGYGVLPGSYVLSGTLEKCAVHNVALSAATVASLAQAALTPPPGSGVSVMIWNGSQYVQAADMTTTSRPNTGVVIWESGPSRPVAAMTYDIWVPTP